MKWLTAALLAMMGSVGASAACSAQASANLDTPDGWKAGYARLAAMGRGFVVWESRRSGKWRIYRVELDGTGLRQLSPDEPDRDHLCPHISPDGRRIAYISTPAGSDVHDTRGVVNGKSSPLRLMSADGRFDRLLVPDARSYGGDRAVVWLNGDEIVYIDPQYRTQRMVISTGQSDLVLEAPPKGELPLLLDASGRYVTAGRATFSPYNSADRSVKARPRQDGCEPYFSHDGVWGYWMGGAGGPINRFRLADASVSPIIAKHDPRMPKGRAYLYFPMLAASGRLFAFAASPDQHNHDTSDYDVFVAPIDPSTLELTGNPVRYSFHAACDRYPDVFLEEAPAQTARGPAPAKPASKVRAAPPGAPEAPKAPPGEWPLSRDGLVFLWETSKRPNTAGPAGGGQAYTPAARGRARLNRTLGMAISDGAFVSDGAADALLKACKATNQLTIEATMVPYGLAASGPARIITFSSSAQERNFTLGQEGDTLVLRLRTPATGVNGYNPEVRLCTIEAGRPVHVTVTYAPGELVAYRDGKEVLRTKSVQGDFRNWTPQHLLFGDEWNGERQWTGSLEGVALYNRVLPPAEVANHAAAYRKLLVARKPAQRIQVQAVLERTSKVPSTADIRPYKSGLMVNEYRVTKVLAGACASRTVRVAHWVILNGAHTPVAGAKKGAEVVLRLEAFDANPQLASQFISDTLPEDWDAALYFDVGNP